MTETTTCFIAFAEIVLCSLTITLNITILAKSGKGRLLGRHTTMLMVKVVYDLVSVLSALSYCTSMLIGIYEGSRNKAIFWTGNLFHSLLVSMAILNLFVGLDRLLAVTKPGKYFSYCPKVQKASIALMITVCAAAFLCYALTELPHGEQRIFSQYADPQVMHTIYSINCVLFAGNILVTVAFLISFWNFMKNRLEHGLSGSKTRNIANRIVIYQMLLEIVILIIPTFLTSAAKLIFGLNLPDRWGPYVQALYVAYTTMSAVVFWWNAPKKGSVQFKVSVAPANPSNPTSAKLE